uniref:HTH cro/C1-type domain-containing protein n=1 Tax=Romanomermis culicivorax TaxID=13658 RepID=A0A915HFQ6_ROMCU
MNLQSDSHWDSVTVLKKKAPKPSELRTQQAINQAQRSGQQIDTSKKFNAATNRQHQTTKNVAQLDRETEELHHKDVGLDVGRLIQQGRATKNWTQNDLAKQICEKQSIINEYESGKAVANQQILSKLERALGIRLRGKEKGQPLPVRGAPKKDEKK